MISIGNDIFIFIINAGSSDLRSNNINGNGENNDVNDIKKHLVKRTMDLFCKYYA